MQLLDYQTIENFFLTSRGYTARFATYQDDDQGQLEFGEILKGDKIVRRKLVPDIESAKEWLALGWNAETRNN